MTSKYSKATDNLKKVSKQTEDFLKTISGSAEHLSAKDSSALYGTLGGLFGTLAGIIVGVYLPFLGTLVVSTTLTALGAVAGVLVYRGKRRIRLERVIEERMLLIGKVLNLIQQLPKNTPDEVRYSLWKSFIETNEMFDSEVKTLMKPTKSFEDNTKNLINLIKENSVLLRLANDRYQLKGTSEPDESQDNLDNSK